MYTVSVRMTGKNNLPFCCERNKIYIIYYITEVASYSLDPNMFCPKWPRDSLGARAKETASHLGGARCLGGMYWPKVGNMGSAVAFPQPEH